MLEATVIKCEGGLAKSETCYSCLIDKATGILLPCQKHQPVVKKPSRKKADQARQIKMEIP
jgi:hypothetical protein